MSQVILVNDRDEVTGIMEKMEAHEKGLLHRAFSIFIFDNNNQMLLQQRADNKYHSPGLWTNACCSHPLPGELTLTAAYRRLEEELGFKTNLEEIFSFTYKATFENGLTEHEYDHVFIGRFEGAVRPEPSEVKACHYIEMTALKESIATNPQLYTAWFKIAFPKLEEYLAGNKF